ncbi:zinc finger BED domain-containing protein RICESLEEPER 2-like [Senna tora]|uniref:Zinc finger BED domain-containing protein RICESLEEPER 2-like n=1 Tax=Senna tora TaxID=362788 RepID=A0A834WM95_9FABA|nr:zinc finger BED domain-containing protein RICESLEEPER 2-like [Senna tora]
MEDYNLKFDEVDFYALQEAIRQEDEVDVEEEAIAKEIEAEAQASQVNEAASKKRKTDSTLASTSNPTGTSTESEKGITSKKRPSKPPSWTWSHFTEKKIGDSARAVCNWCGTRYACDRKKNGTSNLKGHLINLCKEFPRDLKKDPKQKVLAFQPKRKEQGETLATVCFEHELCREALARMVITDELPFRFVEGEGFRYYMSVVQPLFNVPSRLTVARDCYKLYVSEKNRLKLILSKNLQHKRIIAWKGSVLRCELLHMRCCAHILNLIVMDGLKDVNDSILKIRNEVRYVRWNSTYLMLESALKFQSAFERLEYTSSDFLLEFGRESDRTKGPLTLVD